MTYLRKRKNALVYAFRGLAAAARKESHMRVHIGAAALVTLAGAYFGITPMQWVAVLVSVAAVIISELFNTVAERLCDMISTGQRPDIGYVKDISAGAVLVACLMAVAVGLLVFLPYITP